MPTLARLEQEITELAAEAKRVLQACGRALPDVQQWVDFLVEGLAMSYEVFQALLAEGQAAGEGDAWVFRTHLQRMALPPAAEPLRPALTAVVERALGEDLRGYIAARRALRGVLGEFLVLRARKWRHDWEARRLLSAGGMVDSSQAPEEAARQRAAGLRGWDIVVDAGRALRAAAAELEAWLAWVQGGAVEQHARLMREGAGGHARSSRDDPALQWAREVEKHTLPEEEEAELVSRGLASAEELAAVRALSLALADAQGVADRAARARP